MNTAAIEALIVEDSPTQALSLSVQLEELGIAAQIAGTLAEALSALSEGSFDVIVLDLELPDATGLEGLARLHEARGEIPIVVLTSSHGQELAIQALQEGAEDYLSKDRIGPATVERSIRYAIERHRQRNALVALAAELEMANQQKDHLMGVVAHDLRNPLGVVRGYSDLLLGGLTGELADDQAEVVSTVRRTSDYMLRLVEDLLDYSRIQTGVMTLERAPTDLAALVRETMRPAAMIGEQKEISFTADLDEGLPDISLDGHKIRQVIDNLFTNAVKFSHPKSEVEVVLRRVGEHALLTVTDHGVGIPSDELSLVFGAFQKTSARPTGGERSTGLGLAIVRNIVTAHAGEIWVESVLGEGSTFHVSLPFI